MFLFRRKVYFDSNATTTVAPSVVREMCRVLSRCHGNPSSLYKDARESARIISDSRWAVAEAVNASPEEIFFTASASEALNTVLKSVYETFPSRKIISSPIEHSSVINTLEYLAGKGAKVEFCPVDGQGFVDTDRLRRSSARRTALFSAAWRRTTRPAPFRISRNCPAWRTGTEHFF